MAPRLRFLRPYLCQPLSPGASSKCSAYLRLYDLGRAAGLGTCQTRRRCTLRTSESDPEDPVERSAFVAARVQKLRSADALQYPRYKARRGGKHIDARSFKAANEGKSVAEMQASQEVVTVSGRVETLRRHGTKFFFANIVNDGVPLQSLVNFSKMEDGTTAEVFKQTARLIQRGDHISITGRAVRSSNGTLSLEATGIPHLISPNLVPVPHRVSEDSKMRQRHMEFMVNRKSAEIMRIRSRIINCLRSYMINSMGCMEVQTPILAADAGGALARPFNTYATEFSKKELALRIAPELWLKRLVVGGFEKVFELGPAFRNEGLDATHNPEFTMCEFYKAYTNLDDLILHTQSIFTGLVKDLEVFKQEAGLGIEFPPASVFQGHYKRFEFIPALEEALGRKLPDLDSPTAFSDILKILEETGRNWRHSLPSENSLAGLLDHMAAELLEPQSMGNPIFITNHPVCMSPLAKSFTCPKTGQQVSARAELFFDGKELANMYEEENDPFEQRRKFVEQAQARTAQRGGSISTGENPAHVIDEQYISVLESGLPPTGGWGCGVDRLVMLFTGAKRISDVLPFGNLRNVVGLASAGAQSQNASLEVEAAGRDTSDKQ